MADSEMKKGLESMYKAIENSEQPKWIQIRTDSLREMIDKAVASARTAWIKELEGKMKGMERLDKHLIPIDKVTDETWDAGFNSCLAQIKQLIQ